MVKRVINSFGYALQGIVAALKTERNLKIHVVIMLLVIIAGVLLKISLNEWMVCIILFGVVISSELMNTAIERIVDVVSKEKNEDAKFIKDVSAGTVLVVAVIAAVIGCMIFVPALIK